MEDTETVPELTEFVSPIDPKIRRGFEMKFEEYSRRLRGKGELWEKVPDFKQRHAEFIDFRYVRYKHSLVQALLQRKPGEIINIGNEFMRLETILEAKEETVDEEVFKNCCVAIYQYSIGELELPSDESNKPINPVAQPS
jgi:hypothetical protein